MRERLLSANGAELWVAEQGTGIPMMLCNGGPGCCDYLGTVAECIDDVAQVYRFEPRGCGRSSSAGPYDLPTTLADLEALRVALGHVRWVVGGHSWGADLALAYALEYPKHVLALAYISGAGVQNDREWHAVYQAGRDAGRDQTPAFEYPVNLEVNRTGNASWRRFIKGPMLLRRIADLNVPMLAVYGSEDIRPSWPVEQIVHLMPNARYELIEGAGHCVWLTHAPELRSLLGAFLREVSRPAGAESS